MNIARHHLFILLIAALASQSCATSRLYVAEKAETEEQVFAIVESFYSWVLAHRFVSLPSDKERSELTAFLTPELIKLMEDAEEIQGRCFEVTPEGEKPMMLEGALLVGLYEGATEVAYGDLETKNGVVTLPIILIHAINDDTPKASRFRVSAWNDELELRREEGKLLISDINFPYGRSLRSTLQDYINCGRQECITPKAVINKKK